MPLTTLHTDQPPAKTSDVPLRVYSNPICPFAQRVRLIAAAKSIPNEEVNIHLKLKPEWFPSQINPHGQVPVIEHNGHLIRESRIAFDYIDAAFGGPSLWPADPYKRAMDQLLVDDFGSKFIPNFYKYYCQTADESTAAPVKEFLKRLNDLIKLHPGGFVAEGTSPGAVDYLIWPWFERLPAIQLFSPQFSEAVKQEDFPDFFGWIERMKATDAVKKLYQPPEAHLAFVKSVQAGVHDYSHADVTSKGITIYAKKEE
jgi:glutathione S-transferase